MRPSNILRIGVHTYYETDMEFPNCFSNDYYTFRTIIIERFPVHPYTPGSLRTSPTPMASIFKAASEPCGSAAKCIYYT
jgi:hypothetical protein